MLKQLLKTFSVGPDCNLDNMKDWKILSEIAVNILNVIKPVLDEESPNVALVHRDANTTFVTALACFYL